MIFGQTIFVAAALRLGSSGVTRHSEASILELGGTQRQFDKHGSPQFAVLSCAATRSSEPVAVTVQVSNVSLHGYIGPKPPLQYRYLAVQASQHEPDALGRAKYCDIRLSVAVEIRGRDRRHFPANPPESLPA